MGLQCSRGRVTADNTMGPLPMNALLMSTEKGNCAYGIVLADKIGASVSWTVGRGNCASGVVHAEKIGASMSGTMGIWLEFGRSILQKLCKE